MHCDLLCGNTEKNYNFKNSFFYENKSVTGRQLIATSPFLTKGKTTFIQQKSYA